MDSFFKEAVPVWVKGRSLEMNLSAGFYGEFGWDGSFAGKGKELVLRMTGSSLYRIFLNGNFVGHGPARAAHGFYRVDEIVLDKEALGWVNRIAIEAAGFNTGSFYLLDQPSFLQAELVLGDHILLATGADEGSGKMEEDGSRWGRLFQAMVLEDRLQRVQRYSFQRVFLEAYRISENYDGWRVEGFPSDRKVPLEELEEKSLLPRNVSYSSFPVKEVERIFARGSFGRKEDAAFWEDRSFLGISGRYKGYKKEDLELVVSQELDRLYTLSLEKEERLRETDLVLEEGNFAIVDMGYNTTGFAGADLECLDDCVLYFVFDEVLMEDEDILYNRMCCVNGIRYEMKKGTYRVETLQPYTLRYGKWMAVKGVVRVRNVWVREYTNPDAAIGLFDSSDKVVNRIFEAGRKTFAQNVVDLYMDCPSRERAGWLCDSYFTSRVEAVLTGSSRVEDNFLENYCLPRAFADIPEGMLPMCYPADHTTGEFIPNWALWLILELEEYQKRKPGESLSARFLGKVEKLFDYFKGFENEDGLLENLEGWVFVEWSRANSLTDGVNYPSNMLYSRALKAAGRIYGRKDWYEKGESAARTIRSQSYQDGFFADHSVRKDGKLCLEKDVTEVCQYYAFEMGIADPDSFPQLFHRLCRDFGPERDAGTVWPQVPSANAFIGNYLRLELLSRYGLVGQLVKETKAFFDYMVCRNGTLWENTGAYASCNHGFASHVIFTYYRDLLGVYEIDCKRKKVIIRLSAQEVESCYGSIPVGADHVELGWKYLNGECLYGLRLPEGYEAEIVNNTGGRIMEVDVVQLRREVDLRCQSTPPKIN